jgi:hypothetical protein
VPVTVILSPPRRFMLVRGTADVIVQVMTSYVRLLLLGTFPYLVTISGKCEPHVGSLSKVHSI